MSSVLPPALRFCRALFRRRAAPTIAFLGVLLAGPTLAIPIDDYPDVEKLIESLAKAHGFERAALRRLFADATLRPDIIAAIERPREALPWHEYRKIFITDERVRLGASYWQRHKKTLARAERDYGVPAELIVAIIGVETRYGANKGEYATIDALLTLTLGFPRRADFFRRELEEFLLLARELKIDPRKVKGSYAGALGIPQFIPSSYRRYAIDFDGDRKRDLLQNDEDAIGSVANFLRSHGWDPGKPVIDLAQIDSTLYLWPEQLGLQPGLRLREWLSHGIFPRPDPAQAGMPLDTERPAALVLLEGETGPLYHLGYNNFYVISRYNRSKSYAMAVYELARSIRRQHEGT